MSGKPGQPPQPNKPVRPYPRSSEQDGPAAAGTVASVAKAKARARTIFVMRVSYGSGLVVGAGRMAERMAVLCQPHGAAAVIVVTIKLFPSYAG
jgi:hypothetical protein